MQTPGEGGLPEEEARDLTLQICTGMAYCHRQNVTHRDLKPEVSISVVLTDGPERRLISWLSTRQNVLITKGDKPRVKIADFGLAKMINHSGTMFVLSQSQPILNSPG